MAMTTTEGIQYVLGLYGDLIEKYRQDIPANVVAARIWHETRGVSCPPPTKCCDERGLLQLWPDTRKTYGVTNACDPDQNIRAGCAHWNAEARKMQAAIPGLFPSRDTSDFWKAAYLYTAIGSGATTKLFLTAPVQTGTAFSDLLNWVNEVEGSVTFDSLKPWFGTQSPATIAKRVRAADTFVNAAMESGEVAAEGDLGVVGIALVVSFGWLIMKWIKK
jgi:hypothetical protein